MITKKAYAKVNLTLDITGRREDGYHLVRMVMQSLDVADVLTFEKTETDSHEDPENRIITRLTDNRNTDSDELGTLPNGPDNLIYRVAELLMKKYVWPEHPESGVEITLEKNIPIAAGLAGGSSDAAATFKGINELFELGLMDDDLMNMGVSLGADIPYCIMGGTALSEGIGEKLTRLPALPKCYILLAKPNISVSTGEAYGGYDRLASEAQEEETISGGKVTREILAGSVGKLYRIYGDRKLEIPDVDGQVDAIYAGNLKGVTDKMANVLEYVTAEKHPEIEQLKKVMMDTGALRSMMSGSGPTVYGIYRDRDEAVKAAELIGEMDTVEQVFVAEPV